MYTTKRLLAILLSVILVIGTVSVAFAAESIGVAIYASKTSEVETLELETSDTFTLYFGVDKFSLSGKTLNTYEFTVWYNENYVTLNIEEIEDVTETEGYPLLAEPIEKTFDGVDYKGQTFTFTSFKKGFGEAESENFNALVKLPFKAKTQEGTTNIFIEAEGVTLLPVANSEDFTAKLSTAVLNDEVKVTIEDEDDGGGSFFGGGVGSSAVKRTVIFNVDGVKNSVTITDGKKIAKPADPVKEGYKFIGWFEEKTDLLFDFNNPVVDSVMLIAKFEKSDEPVVPALPFTDVNEADWFYQGVKYVFEQNMVKGVSDTLYGPDNTLTRATLVTLLYRMENEPQASANAFSDVASGAWYENAVAWAAGNEIVLGVGEGLFAPDNNITREQIAVILYKYAKLKGKDVSKTADLTAFSDAAEISDWAKDALSWAVAEGLIQGMGENTVAPTATATRAQIATILMRYMN